MGLMVGLFFRTLSIPTRHEAIGPFVRKGGVRPVYVYVHERRFQLGPDTSFSSWLVVWCYVFWLCA